MYVSRLEQTAKTPPLGGIFGDLRLTIKPWFKVERRKYFQEAFDPRQTLVDGNMVTLTNEISLAKEYDEKILSLITDWENIFFQGTKDKVPCTTENKKLYLMNNCDEETGHAVAREIKEGETLPDEMRKLNLFQYIDQFSSNMENYEGNFPGTA